MTQEMFLYRLKIHQTLDKLILAVNVIKGKRNRGRSKRYLAKDAEEWMMASWQVSGDWDEHQIMG